MKDELLKQLRKIQRMAWVDPPHVTSLLEIGQVAHDAIAALEAAQGVPDDYDMEVLRELSATLKDRSPERHLALERLLARAAIAGAKK